MLCMLVSVTKCLYYASVDTLHCLSTYNKNSLPPLFKLVTDQNSKQKNAAEISGI